MSPPIKPITRGSPWSVEEVEATVAAYLEMLTLQLTGQKYSKTEFRNALLPRLVDRSESSVEMKFHNISAVMIELGCMTLTGYVPRYKYQAMLADVVGAQVQGNMLFDAAAQAAVAQPATLTTGINFAEILQPPPRRREQVNEPKAEYSHERRAFKRDYLAREAANRSLGLAGEKFVLEFEHYRLHTAGAKKLADKVEHVSVMKGDGLGYDILSYDTNGRERLIEVKTTSFSAETPFFVSRNELKVAEANQDYYRICRVFDFRREPRMYEVAGSYSKHFLLNPVSYQATR